MVGVMRSVGLSAAFLEMLPLLFHAGGRVSVSVAGGTGLERGGEERGGKREGREWEGRYRRRRGRRRCGLSLGVAGYWLS